MGVISSGIDSQVVPPFRSDIHKMNLYQGSPVGGEDVSNVLNKFQSQVVLSPIKKENVSGRGGQHPPNHFMI